MTVTTTDNVRSHRQAIAAYNRHDVDAMVSLRRQDSRLTDHATGQTMRGPDEIRAYIRANFDAFSDDRFEDADIIGVGAWTVLRGRTEGTHDGSWGGVEPTGARGTLDVCAVARWDAGRLVEEHLYYDLYGLLAQLGLVPPLDAPGR